MIGKEQTNAEELKMQGLLDRYLRSRVAAADSAAPHLDEDALNAFTEARLSLPEASIIIKHLLECSFCLHVSAELLRLEADFGEQEKPFSSPAASEPTKISDVLNNLLAKIFSGGEGAVFAHEEKKENQNAEAEEENKKDS